MRWSRAARGAERRFPWALAAVIVCVASAVTLAKGIETAQEAEIATMQGLLS